MSKPPWLLPAPSGAAPATEAGKDELTIRGDGSHLDLPAGACHTAPASRLDDRADRWRKPVREESPGSTETRCRVTPGEGDLRESATEIEPPRCAGVRVKRWCKRPPRDRQRDRHGKPHREQDRIGMTWAKARPVSGLVVRVGCTRRPATGVPDEWSSGGKPLTEPGLQTDWLFSCLLHLPRI